MGGILQKHSHGKKGLQRNGFACQIGKTFVLWIFYVMFRRLSSVFMLLSAVGIGAPVPSSALTLAPSISSMEPKRTKTRGAWVVSEIHRHLCILHAKGNDGIELILFMTENEEITSIEVRSPDMFPSDQMAHREFPDIGWATNDYTSAIDPSANYVMSVSVDGAPHVIDPTARHETTPWVYHEGAYVAEPDVSQQRAFIRLLKRGETATFIVEKDGDYVNGDENDPTQITMTVPLDGFRQAYNTANFWCH